MARRSSYVRDSRGRFASTPGGSSGSSKKPKATGGASQSTRTTNKLRANQLRDQGTIAIGSRVKTKGFAGGKAAQRRAGGIRSESGPISIRGGARAFTVGKGGKMSAAKQAATSKAIKSLTRAKSRAGQVGKPLARTDKSPVSAAKARYKELNQRARRSSPFRSASENRSAAGAKRSLKVMIAKRGR